MGRGSGEDRAIRLSAIPRRMRGAKEIGQRRYRLAQQRGDNSLSGEPGYIRSVHESSKRRWDSRRMVLVEEVAVSDKDGRLHWLESDIISAGRYEHWASVGEARDICDNLNKKPLGSDLVREVDDQGLLNIRKVRRSYSGAIRRMHGAPDIIEEVEKGGSFDVEDPAQAKQAKELYTTLKEEVGSDKESAAESLLTKLRGQGNKKALNLFPNQEIANRSRASEQFAQALDGRKIEEVLKASVEAEEKEDVAEDKKLSARAKQTIDALSQT